MECDRPDRCRTTVEEGREGGRRKRRRGAGAERSLGGGDADGNGQSSGRPQQRKKLIETEGKK